jgi:DNA gyrase/topoisomerase IV subunit A
MIHKRDIQWWILEAEKHPESAKTIIEELAKRLIELDTENERLRNELVLSQQRAPKTANSAQVKTLQRKVETLQNLLHSKEPTEASIVLFSDQLHSTRIALSQAQRLVRDNHPLLDSRSLLELRCMLLANPGDGLLLLTNQGQGFRQELADVPPMSRESGWSTTKDPVLQSGERLAAAVSVGKPPRFWTVATRRGYVQRFVRIHLERGIDQGQRLLNSPLRNDEPAVILDGDRGDLLLVTRWGKGVRFSQRAIETQGSIALELDADDNVVGALTLPRDMEILIVTASGYAARRDTALFRARSRPGGTGKALIQAHDVLAIYPYTSRAQLLYLTYSGKMMFVPVEDIPLRGRLGKGTHLRDISRDPAVTVTLIPQS